MRIERLLLAMTPIASMGFGSAALAAIDPIDAIGVCARISKKDARLECYDQVARDATSGRLQSSGPVAAAPPSNWAAPPAAVQAPRPQVAPAATFGGEALRAGSEADGPDAIRAEVASSTDNGLGQWRIRLADGAVWQMTERVSMFRPPAPREVVAIRKASLGSFLMDVGQQGAVRVRRVQ